MAAFPSLPRGRIVTFAGADAIDQRDATILVSGVEAAGTGGCRGACAANDVSIAQVISDDGATMTPKIIG